jgi:hypothetical protein
MLNEKEEERIELEREPQFWSILERPSYQWKSLMRPLKRLLVWDDVSASPCRRRWRRCNSGESWERERERGFVVLNWRLPNVLCVCQQLIINDWFCNYQIINSATSLFITTSTLFNVTFFYRRNSENTFNLTILAFFVNWIRICRPLYFFIYLYRAYYMYKLDYSFWRMKPLNIKIDPKIKLDGPLDRISVLKTNKIRSFFYFNFEG